MADSSFAGGSVNTTWTPMEDWAHDEMVTNFTTNFTTHNSNLTVETSSGIGGDRPHEIFILVSIIIGLLSVSIILFITAFVIDRRYQRLKEETSRPKRIPTKKSRIPVFIANGNMNSDALAFASEMCNENSATTAVKIGVDANC